MKVVIGVPVSRLFDQRTAVALVNAVVDVAKSGNDCELIFEGNHERPLSIVEARNRIAIKAIETDAEYLLWIDSDATSRPGMVTRLLSRNVPIVSALCFKRKYPVTPACGHKHPHGGIGYPPPIAQVSEWINAHPGLWSEKGAVLLPDEPGALLPVAVVGTHYTLVKREVFEALPHPWYVRTTAPGVGSTGSDYYFCDQAKALGFDVFVDLTAISGHLEGSHTLGVYDFVAWTMAAQHSQLANQPQGAK